MNETEEKFETNEDEAPISEVVSEETEVVEDNNEDENVVPLAAEEKVEEDFKSKFMYLAAEMDNLRRRNDRERENLLKFGNEKVLSGLLEVVDNLDRTLEAISNDEDEKIKNISLGIEMVNTQLLDVLKSNGLEEVSALGEVFDPNIHEAMAQQPAEGKEDQEIISVFQKGYKLNGRLLRAAKVIVVKK